MGAIPESTRRLEAETAPLWRALADPTRRRILDRLRAGPAITGEIAAAFPISRIAVMRHLEMLAEAQLITSRKRGRERWHYLNAVPLERLYRRWAGPVEAGFDRERAFTVRPDHRNAGMPGGVAVAAAGRTGRAGLANRPMRREPTADLAGEEQRVGLRRRRDPGHLGLGDAEQLGARLPGIDDPAADEIRGGPGDRQQRRRDEPGGRGFGDRYRLAPGLEPGRDPLPGKRDRMDPGVQPPSSAPA